MEAKDFIIGTVSDLNDRWFDALKEKLLGEYFEFVFIDNSLINKDILAEKIFDYFEKLQLKTDLIFYKFVQKYLSDWDDIVKRKIAKEPQAKKGAPQLPIPRARKYYNRAINLKDSRNVSVKQVIDYSRIMMCLYIDIIDSDFEEISDFDYSSECLNLDKIITAMKNKKADGINIFDKRNAFNIEDLFCTDTSTFIITIIMFYCIKNLEIVEE